ERIVGRAIRAPSAAVDEDVDRRVRLLGAEDVELLDLGQAIGNALRHAQNGAHLFAVDDAALADLIAVGGIDHLVVGVVERLLVHVEPDERSFRTRAAGGNGRRTRGGQYGGSGCLAVRL